MPAAADPSTTTVTVGRFQVIGTLGQGSQSVVYLAFDPQLHREVAVKSLRLTEETPDAADMLLNEARAVSRLSHPALVPVFEAGEHGGNPYLVFEYVAGQTLAEQLAESGAQEPEKVVDLLLPVLDAVEYAHANRVSHGVGRAVWHTGLHGARIRAFGSGLAPDGRVLGRHDPVRDDLR